MDVYDKNIAFELMDNSRQTLRQLSEKIGLTGPSIKKRIDRLVEDGFIKEYIVLLGFKYIKATDVIILVKTDGSINVEDFIECVQVYRSIFLIVPMVSGELFLRVSYSHPDELSEVVSMVSDFSGVTSIEVHTTEICEGGGNLSEFTTVQLRILSQLVLDPRMPPHEIAARSGLSVKKVNQNLDILIQDNMVIFGIKWNPFGKGTSVVVAPIRYDTKQTTPDYVNDWFITRYPIEFWYSRLSKEEPLLFAIFGISDMKKLEEITRDIQNQKWAEAVSVLIGYSSTNPDTPTMTMLVDLLTIQGLWPPCDKRI